MQFLHIFVEEETVGQGAMRHFGEYQQLHLSAFFDPELGTCDCGLMAGRPVLHAMGYSSATRVFVVTHQCSVSLCSITEMFESLMGADEAEELLRDNHFLAELWETGDEPEDAS